MTQSYGEQVISVNATIIGRVRVLQMQSASPIYPRLGILLGVTLGKPGSSPFNASIPDAFELRDLRGELRLQEHGGTVASIEWAGPRRFVRSDGHEHRIETVCELDRMRVERIEELRNGSAPTFHLQLWPTLVASGEWLDSETTVVLATVPRDTWVAILDGWNHSQTAVLEVPFAEVRSDQFKKAVRHLTKARQWLSDGEYTAVVSECRLAIDGLFVDLDETDKSKLARQLMPAVPSERADRYSAVVKALKDVAAEAHHKSADFGRAEAMFVLQSVSHAIAFVGRTSINRQNISG